MIPAFGKQRVETHTAKRAATQVNLYTWTLNVFIFFCTGLSKEYALCDDSHSHRWSRAFFGPKKMKKKPQKCEEVWCLLEREFGFKTTVLFKALFTLLIYCISPLTSEGYWCFFFKSCLTFASKCWSNVFVHFMLCYKGKKNLPRCPQPHVCVSPCSCVGFLLKMKIKSMRDLYLFDEHFLGC